VRRLPAWYDDRSITRRRTKFISDSTSKPDRANSPPFHRTGMESILFTAHFQPGQSEDFHHNAEFKRAKPDIGEYNYR
jgi:hypothetical protein